LAALVAWTACAGATTADGGKVTGTAVYAESVVLPPGVVFEATLLDVSRMDVAADVLARARIEDAGNPPYDFVLSFDPARIVPSRRYAVRATLSLAGRLLFTSDQAYPVITGGNPTHVEIALRQVAGAAGLAAEGRPGDLYATLPATFAGTLPCADCEGIAFHLDILPDASFMLRTRYLGKPADPSFDDIGSWALSSDGVTLVLQGSMPGPTYFAIVDRDTLRMRDTAGRPFESQLDYDLRRSDFSPIEPSLSMRGMFRYMADAARFGECLTGRSLPVAMEGGYLDLERAYLAAGTGPGQSIMALVEGRIAMREPMEGPAKVPTLVVDRFLRLVAGEQCPPRFQAATLEGTHWKLASLAEEAIAPVEGQPVPTLYLDKDNGRLAGSDGCNRVLAGYQLEGPAIRFSQLASTMMACPEGANIAQAYSRVLAETRRWRVLGRQLELYDSAHSLLARFEVGTAP